MKKFFPSFAPGFAFVLVSIASFAAMAFAQKEESAKSARGAYEELSKAPEKARSRVNPLALDPEAVAAGRLLFEDHCAECHGDNAEGGKPGAKRRGPSLRAPEVQSAADGALFWVLTNGVVRRGMPVWSKLPEPQRWQLVRYIKSLGAAPPEKTANATP